MAAVDSVLRYHSWNANCLDEAKIRCMMPIWQESDFVFIQETRLASSNEAKITEIVKSYGFDCMFHAAIKSNPSSDYLRDGVCVFFKQGIDITYCDMEQIYPDIQMKNRQRIMLIRSKSVLVQNESIYFINLYFPTAHAYSDPTRDAEREEWITTMSTLCRKLKNKFVVWLGDFNAMKQNQTLIPSMRPSDARCKLFARFQAMFERHNFLNVTEKLWRDDVYTRYGFYNHEMIISRLDYIVVSQKLQSFNFIVEPVYIDQIYLSDHINVKCNIRVASPEHPDILMAQRISCEVPKTASVKRRQCPYPNCGKIFSKPSKLIIHIRRHTGEKPFGCTKNCGYRSTEESSMTRHQALCQGAITIRILKCPDCPAETPIQEQYNSHRISCLARKANFDQSAEFRCTKCLYSTNTPANWQRHMSNITHNSLQILQWYFCLECNFLCQIKSNYERHLTTEKHLQNAPDEKEMDEGDLNE